jgi:hypothetical protein
MRALDAFKGVLPLGLILSTLAAPPPPLPSALLLMGTTQAGKTELARMLVHPDLRPLLIPGLGVDSMTKSFTLYPVAASTLLQHITHVVDVPGFDDTDLRLSDEDIMAMYGAGLTQGTSSLGESAS